jgi:hypothetical protein
VATGESEEERAPVDEGFRLTQSDRRHHEGWSAKHFYGWYKKEGGSRNYTWVKSCLQEAEIRPKGQAHGAHRQRRERKASAGMAREPDSRFT